MIYKKLVPIVLSLGLFACANSNDYSDAKIEKKVEAQQEKIVQLEKEHADKTVYFEANEFTLSKDAQENLDEEVVGWLLKDEPTAKIILNGHADENGTAIKNKALAKKRANAVKDYLVAHGINANRIQTKSYGSNTPAATDHEEKSEDNNRRAVTVFQVK